MLAIVCSLCLFYFFYIMDLLCMYMDEERERETWKRRERNKREKCGTRKGFREGGRRETEREGQKGRSVQIEPIRRELADTVL